MAEDGGTESNGKSSDNPPQASLDKAGEFAKYLAALATGALVFSKDLLGKDFTIVGGTRYLIVAAWICLALSVVAGIFALARIPMMMRKGIYDVEDKYLVPPLRAQQVLCFFGVLALGGALAAILWTKPVNAEQLATSKGSMPEKQISASAQCQCPCPFAIVSSAPERSGAEDRHQHTLLLNQGTGQIWEMVCLSKRNVQFRKVPVGDVVMPAQKNMSK